MTVITAQKIAHRSMLMIKKGINERQSTSK
nr:MAG TPA: hypothetical protein [Caudoviricetes sp.]